MEDTGGKSGRRPGRHLQVEASGPGNAASVQQRLAGRFRGGEVAEGYASGAEGRSKGLICLRRTWMEDTGGKSGRHPGRHLQVEASRQAKAATAATLLRMRHGSRTERGRPAQCVGLCHANKTPPPCSAEGPGAWGYREQPKGSGDKKSINAIGRTRTCAENGNSEKCC